MQITNSRYSPSLQLSRTHTSQTTFIVALVYSHRHHDGIFLPRLLVGCTFGQSKIVIEKEGRVVC
jgi:hypothetical protein